MAQSLPSCGKWRRKIPKPRPFPVLLNRLRLRISFSIFIRFNSPVSGWVREEEPILIDDHFFILQVLSFLCFHDYCLLFLLLSGAETPCFLSYTKFDSPSIFLSLKFSRFLLKRPVSADQLFRYLDAIHGRGGDPPCIACPFPTWKKAANRTFKRFISGNPNRR